MAERIIIPRMGQTMTEGTVASWYVKDGDKVNAGDDIYELEYDKSTAAITAKTSGTVRLLCEEGDVIPLGQAVAVVLAEGESLDSVNIKGEYEVANSANTDTETTNKAVEKKEAKEKDADIIIIGGGPGGYVSAIKSAMLGAKVILVEKDSLGGTCLNRGCIPTKAILQSSEVYKEAFESSRFGINIEGISFDSAKINAYKEKVVGTLVNGVKGLLKARKVTVINGKAVITGKNSVSVSLENGDKKIFTADNIVIAAGSKPSKPPIPGIDGDNVISSTEALDLRELPKSMVVIGGGVIGMEIGAAYSNLGVAITVIEALDTILPNMDEEVSALYRKIAEKKMEIHTSARVESISGSGKDKTVSYKENGTLKEVKAEKVLVCIGRLPDISELGLEAVGIKTDRGAVVTDEEFKSSVDNIYCIGDANRKCMLAHAASAQGVYLAEKLFGKGSNINLDLVPSCIYTDPEIASVGMTEKDAKEAGIDYKVGKFNLRGNGRSLVLDKTSGFVKIIGTKEHNEILGVHIIGPFATELIASCTMAMKLEACVEDIAETIHAHPTVSESIMEAAESFLGGAIHSL